jgi:hypothetical protein
MVSILAFLIGAVIIYGVTAKPSFIWNNYKVVRLRKSVGDSAAQKIHIVIGVIFIIIGIVKLFG